PDIAGGLNNVATCLESLGRHEEALPRLETALAMWRRLFNGDHTRVANGLHNLAHCQRVLGHWAEAEPACAQAFQMSERLRTKTIGGERQRAAMADVLQLSCRAAAYANVLVRLDRGAEGLDVLERGRARAALDLLERAGHDLVAEAGAMVDSERLQVLVR